MPTLDQLYAAAVAHVNDQVKSGSRDQDELLLTAVWSGATVTNGESAEQHVIDTAEPSNPADMTNIFITQISQ